MSRPAHDTATRRRAWQRRHWTRVAPRGVPFVGLARDPRARLFSAAAAGAALLALGLAAPASAGTVKLSQCGAAELGDSPRTVQANLWAVRNGWMESSCGSRGGSLRFDTSNHRLPAWGSTLAYFTVPSTMPHSSLRTAILDWTSMPQARSTNPAFLVVWAGGARVLEVPTGSGSRPGAPDRRDLPAGTRQLVFQTWCSPVNGPGWCNWPIHMLELRGMTVELEESVEPNATARGPLLSGGRRSGVQPLVVDATDGDSGVRRVHVTLGGVPVGGVDLAAACSDDRLPPCPQAIHRTLDIDTSRVSDGLRRLRLEIADAAGNFRVVDLGVVSVSNRPPGGPPGGGPPAGGPPVGAPPVGGAPPAGGSDGEPPAPWPAGLFPPNPLAGRGHVPNGTHADAHAHVYAWLELGGRRLRSASVRRGVRVRIRGRLMDTKGRPIVHAALAMVMRINGRRRSATGVRTRHDGRFTTFTRLGPSRTLRFAYYAFGDSHDARLSPLLRLRVRRR